MTKERCAEPDALFYENFEAFQIQDTMYGSVLMAGKH